ncbi:hypothetical protein OOK31_21165 [Streptomyces sp. NBC_00249]|uniref:hypothetical protein n=1 Tax=Streptomyces sp. NBC_00249 TaxID=2975690 RepID=UPI00224FD572|nr:hypothetical protein [Streptomyces sp. NBC_00249]MCX5196376.1 hypothetical protein [Streptomyces sp. NBC_00249]
MRTPEHGAIRPCGTRQQIARQIAGVLGHPVDIELVAIEVTALDPRDLRATVTVPEVPGGTYRVLVTSVGPLDAYGAQITVTAG